MTMQNGRAFAGPVPMTALMSALIAAAPPARAEGLDSLPFALSAGALGFDARLRYEGVDQNNALHDADAATLRARLGYTTRQWNHLDAAAEYEGITVIGDERYDSDPGPAGQAGYAVVADPRGSELNQAWLRFTGIPQTAIKAGRQRLVLDNARFIGNVGWRQNEQTYDGYLLTHTALPKTVVSYAFLTNANTVLFGDLRMHSHVVNVALAPSPALGLTAYGYLLDFDLSAPRTDSQTVGLRAAGAIPVSEALRLSYALEYADQSGYADAPATVDAEYGLVELGLARFDRVAAKVGYEVLGGDGVHGFQTPLATLHAFQGWADLFLATPAVGIRDAYASLGVKILGVALLAVYHAYAADSGGADLGTETDLQATWAASPALSFGLKYADYNAHTFAVDTRKGWAWMEYRF